MFRNRQFKNSMLKNSAAALIVLLALTVASAALAAELRLLTWDGYAPKNLVEKFEAETGITVNETSANLT